MSDFAFSSLPNDSLKLRNSILDLFLSQMTDDVESFLSSNRDGVEPLHCSIQGLSVCASSCGELEQELKCEPPRLPAYQYQADNAKLALQETPLKLDSDPLQSNIFTLDAEHNLSITCEYEPKAYVSEPSLSDASVFLRKRVKYIIDTSWQFDPAKCSHVSDPVACYHGLTRDQYNWVMDSEMPRFHEDAPEQIMDEINQDSDMFFDPYLEDDEIYDRPITSEEIDNFYKHDDLAMQSIGETADQAFHDDSIITTWLPLSEESSTLKGQASFRPFIDSGIHMDDDYVSTEKTVAFPDTIFERQDVSEVEHDNKIDRQVNVQSQILPGVPLVNSRETEHQASRDETISPFEFLGWKKLDRVYESPTSSMEVMDGFVGPDNTASQYNPQGNLCHQLTPEDSLRTPVNLSWNKPLAARESYTLETTFDHPPAVSSSASSYPDDNETALSPDEKSICDAIFNWAPHSTFDDRRHHVLPVDTSDIRSTPKSVPHTPWLAASRAKKRPIHHPDVVPSSNNLTSGYTTEEDCSMACEAGSVITLDGCDPGLPVETTLQYKGHLNPVQGSSLAFSTSNLESLGKIPAPKIPQWTGSPNALQYSAPVQSLTTPRPINPLSHPSQIKTPHNMPSPYYVNPPETTPVSPSPAPGIIRSPTKKGGIQLFPQNRRDPTKKSVKNVFGSPKLARLGKKARGKSPQPKTHPATPGKSEEVVVTGPEADSVASPKGARPKESVVPQKRASKYRPREVVGKADAEIAQVPQTEETSRKKVRRSSRVRKLEHD